MELTICVVEKYENPLVMHWSFIYVVVPYTLAKELIADSRNNDNKRIMNALGDLSIHRVYLKILEGNTDIVQSKFIQLGGDPFKCGRQSMNKNTLNTKASWMEEQTDRDMDG